MFALGKKDCRPRSAGGAFVQLPNRRILVVGKMTDQTPAGSNIKVHRTDPVRRLLGRLDVPRDGVLLVHSSFKGLSRAGFRAERVLASFVAYMMTTGTLLMPTMSWRAVNPDTPFFDELATPSITGILTELFRTQAATRRSLHPTHSVAGRGARVDELLGSHHTDETPCSARSPWGLLDDYDAWVILLGVRMDSCTLVHHVEESIAPELYLRPSEESERYICRDRYGREVEVSVRRTRRLPRNFWQFEEALAACGELRIGRIDKTVCRAFRARHLVRVVTEALRRRPDAIIARPGQRFRMM